MRFIVKTSRIIHETFDDEVVIVDLDSGSYYSLNATAADLWSFIERGSTLSEMTEHLARQYSGEPHAIQEGILQFLQELQNENLVATVAEESALPASAITVPSDTLPPFTPPLLSKYTDMQELLLIDVIHDVDETGWPNTPQKVTVDSGSL
jgi:hypothetical protein